MSHDPIRIATVLVGLGLTIFFAVTHNPLSPYWLVLLGGMIGVTVVAGNTRQNGSKDDDRPTDGSSRKTFKPLDRSRPPSDRGDHHPDGLRRSGVQAALG